MQMKIRYDNDTDSIYVILSDEKVIESEEISKDVIVDFNDTNEVVAIEILNVKSNEHSIDIPIVLKSA